MGEISPRMLKKLLLYNVVLFPTSILITLCFNLGKIFIVILPLISIGVLVALKKRVSGLNWLL